MSGPAALQQPTASRSDPPNELNLSTPAFAKVQFGGRHRGQRRPRGRLRGSVEITARGELPGANGGVNTHYGDRMVG